MLLTSIITAVTCIISTSTMKTELVDSTLIGKNIEIITKCDDSMVTPYKVESELINDKFMVGDSVISLKDKKVELVQTDGNRYEIRCGIPGNDSIHGWIAIKITAWIRCNESEAPRYAFKIVTLYVL